MRKYYNILLVSLCLALGTGSSPYNPSLTCIPENDLYISVEDKSKTAMDESTFNHVLDVVEGLYEPIIAEKGGDLQIIRKWEDGTVNAYAQRVGKVYKVSMFGGLARHDTVTADGFALVACHEIGHHIGGAPKRASWFGSTWASNEGQADYWGTTKCLKRVFTELKAEDQDPEDKDYLYALKECEKRYDDDFDREVCTRSSMAGKSLAELFRALRNMEKEIHFWTNDKSVVSKTYDLHPAPQCRMDTYFAGSLCNKTVDEVVDDRDPKKGLCVRDDETKMEARPLCWYKP